MDRRDALLAISGALGLALAPPAFAGAPMPDLDPIHPLDVGAHLKQVRAHLDAITARAVPSQLKTYLRTLGLPHDMVGRTMRSMAATAAFRELTPEAQAHPDAQALVTEESLDAGAVAATWSTFLKRSGGTHLEEVAKALRAQPELADVLRERLHAASAEIGAPERWTRVLDRRLERVLWRVRRQSARAEAEMAVETVDRHWRAAGLDPDEVRADALVDEVGVNSGAGVPDGATDSRAERRARRRKAGQVTMAIGGGMVGAAGTAAAVLAALQNPLVGGTILVAVGLPGLLMVLIGFVVFLSALEPRE